MKQHITIQNELQEKLVKRREKWLMKNKIEKKTSKRKTAPLLRQSMAHIDLKSARENFSFRLIFILLGFRFVLACSISVRSRFVHQVKCIVDVFRVQIEPLEKLVCCI